MFGLWIGKCTALLLRLAGRRATSLPGKLALRFSPQILSKLGRQLERCIVVTGTNGKTTTANLLAGMLRTEGPLVHNAEGANMTQGLVSALLAHTDWFGRLQVKTAVFEIDEATLPQVAPDLPIRVVVVTNVFRDQLDRYGEVDGTLSKLLTGIKKTDAMLVLNADDPLAHHIGLTSGRRCQYFGLARTHAGPLTRHAMRDGAFCLSCGERLHYDGHFFGQLGLYKCPNCDFMRPMPDFLGRVEHGTLEIQQNNLPRVRFQLPTRGMFNVYNGLAAISAARVYGLDAQRIARGLAAYRPPIGRMQVFSTSPVSMLNLIKNPAGCDSVLEAVCAEPGDKLLWIAINDQAADGRDVSWLWDADFEQVAEDRRIHTVIASGMRAEDMALRLKYAGLPVERLRVIPDLDASLQEAFAISRQYGGLPVHCLATYTALYPTAEWLERSVTPVVPLAAHRPSVS
ncbi:Mur ligase family protein [Alicyclobacillus sp.]|uniref:Mur ligase family protein n=1 Tax=Alicyclobacillus sp. TaxID=61169 RepID=UPI0025C73E77|nr:Mur ligase family protein [Alicyclobacillus sp.]MCL6515449.1 MurT ligase domain-containing protein [Alicyclobacillus sp.]